MFERVRCPAPQQPSEEYTPGPKRRSPPGLITRLLIGPEDAQPVQLL